MSGRTISDREKAVHKILAGATLKIDHLQMQLDNLPPDKGFRPELKPGGGPRDVPGDRKRAAIEKEIASVKERTLKSVDQELKGALPEEKEHCEYAVGKWQYPEGINPEQPKEINAAQTMIARDQYDKRYPEKDRAKTLDQSQDYIERKYNYQKRYVKEHDQQPEKILEGKDVKTLEESQAFVYSLRYSEQAKDQIKELEKDVQAPEPEHDLEPEID